MVKHQSGEKSFLEIDFKITSISNLHNDGIKLLCKISSDDTFLFSKVHNINKSVNELNADLEKN